MRSGDDPALTAAKQDVVFLKSLLGLNGSKTSDQHAKCPFCQDTCLRYGWTPGAGTSEGAFLCQCMKGCVKGTVVDVIKTLRNCDVSEAIKEAKGRYKPGNGRPLPAPKEQLMLPAPVTEEIKFGKLSPPPVLDMQRAQDFVERYHVHLAANPGLSAKYRRGISEEVIRKYRIGFVENEKVRLWHTGGSILVPAAWVLPITDEHGKLMAVKLHFEKPMPIISGQPMEGKNRWMPFGTLPKFDNEKKIKPRDAYYCLWPHINQQTSPESCGADGHQAEWYIQNIERGSELEDEWERKFSEEKLCLAIDIKKTEDSLDESDINRAMMRAWGCLKTKIMKAILKPKADSGEARVNMSLYTAIVPGELKALAGISAGVMASGSTGGEGWIPPPELLTPYKDRNVCVVVDEDPPKKREMPNGEIKRFCAGPDYGRMLALALLREGALDVRVKSGGVAE